MTTIALFDVDGTLLNENTSIILLKSLYLDKKINLWTLLKAKYHNFLFRINRFDLEDMKKFSLKFMKGWNKKELDEYCNEIFIKQIKPKLHLDMIKKINEHKNKNDLIVLLSAAPEIITSKIVKYIKADFSINSIIEIQNGIISGNLKKICFAENKYEYFMNFCKEKKINLNKSYFYTDSYTDLKVLNCIGFPNVVNPDKKLKKIAKEKGWNIIRPQNEKQK
jgi:HAD superfamily hydrolase (TIGR01490 family)